MSDGAGPVFHLTPEEIDAIRGEITPISEIPIDRHKNPISHEAVDGKIYRKHATVEKCRRW